MPVVCLAGAALAEIAIGTAMIAMSAGVGSPIGAAIIM